MDETYQLREVMDDTRELRERLTRAWQTTLEVAIEQGMPARAVIETMVTVAHERYSDCFGLAAAANYLQLLAEQLRDIEKNDTESLISGDEALVFASGEDVEMAIDPNWLVDGKASG
ncbi:MULTISPECIES: hypothetical protein [Methylobacterium]|uniref:Uncharacterized protein n=1 Tax=Methylobacterium thuringiense TaxID=1003091 RepID=A0ABQ4TUF9_9HYPH|nr:MULTISPECIES: hypothetical protein [Methylobacterium]TXN19841.1 hypothetical protein FV217_20010 [Methylobacterium sp. WL9]GJE57608.1 hypothetical protein EKPJFOCH_4125 [Methylobacterium thuringiense]